MKGIEFKSKEIELLKALLEQALAQAKEDVDDDFLIERDKQLTGLDTILTMMKKSFPASSEIPGMEKAFKEVLNMERMRYKLWRDATALDIVSIQAKLEIQRIELEDKN